ncbi:MAG: SurA N-terminal domain-containing protein [Deltaproteobacteria bacterium]|nr:SurA N-terminal domain-containing protein [Deltaproteobacteria bacterium]
MTLHRSITRLLLLASGLAVLTACQDTFRQDDEMVVTRPVAVVNNEEITFDAFQNAYQEFFAHWENFIVDDFDKEEVKRLILDNMIEDILLDQEARRRGIEIKEDVLRARVDLELNAEGDAPMDERTGSPDKKQDEWVAFFKRRMIHEKLIQREVVSKIRVSDGQSRAYYKAHQNEFIQPEQVRVRHIAVETRGDFDSVVRQLARGRDFISLVREYSITPDRVADGDLGYVERGVMPPEFDQVIFRMGAIGAINVSRPAQTQMGYHLFRLEGVKVRQQMGYLDALPRIRDVLVEEKQSEAYGEWLNSLRSKATIRLDASFLKTELG